MCNQDLTVALYGLRRDTLSGVKELAEDEDEVSQKVFVENHSVYKRQSPLLPLQHFSSPVAQCWPWPPHS